MTRKTGQCKTCDHPQRARIELALANDVDASKTARQFETSAHSIRRHWKSHVTQERKSSLRVVGLSDEKVDLEKLKHTESESLLQNMLANRAQQQRIADKCEQVGLYQEAVRATVAVQKNLELIAKILGELKTGSTTVHQNILLSSDWLVMRRVIAESLRRHPDALRDVLDAIRRVESQGGVEITHARAVERKVIEHQVAP